MWIERSNDNCIVTRADDEERSWLDQYLAFPDNTAKFRNRRVPAWKRGDGKLHLFSQVTMGFPSGLLGSVLKAAKDDAVQVSVIDKRTKHFQAGGDPSALIDWLRDYQHEAVEAARKFENGVFHHVTGAGKTEVMVALGEVYPVQWLVLVNKKDLLAQTAKRYMLRTGEEIGMIGEGQWNPKRITVAMFQTLHAGITARKAHVLKYLAGVQAIAVDECHVTPAKSFWSVVMHCKNAYYRYGFSGTPFARGDKKSLYTWAALGPIIHRISAERLIGEGVLAKPKIRMIPVPIPKKVAEDAAIDLYAEVETAAIVEAKIRLMVTVEAIRQAKKPCLVFVNKIKHGHNIERALLANGIRSEFVWGKKELAERQGAITRLAADPNGILICNVIFQEGIDIPELRSVGMAGGGKSVISALQRTGRGMRKKDAAGNVVKDEFELFDILDKGCGCPAAKRHRACKWLEEHGRGRARAYASEKYETIIDSTFAAGIIARAKSMGL